MQPCASLIENYKTSNGYQIELLKIFFLVLQVTYFVQCGQAKSVRNTLKSLQHYISALLNRFESMDSGAELAAIKAGGPLESFHWLQKEHLGILSNLLNVSHLLQTGAFDKSSDLISRTLTSIDRLRGKETITDGFVTNRFSMLLLENQVRCCVAVGKRASALKHIGEAFKICERDSRLLSLHAPQLHCLLGVYSLAVNQKDAAVSHFNQATNSATDTDLWIYSAMNLSLCYMSMAAASSTSKNQLLTIIENFLPEKIQTQSTSLTAFANYFKAVKCYFSNNLQLAQ